jgi:hypothetical protein
MSQSCVVRIVDTLVCAVVLCTLAFASGQKSLTKLSDLPAEAQSGVSAALGGDIPEYRARATHDGYEVANPRQKLNARFGSRGLEVQAESTRFGMSVRGYGYGTTLTSVRQARPIAASNRVEYRRGSFTEWYVNGPMGLEQGFTLSRRPGKANGQLLRIAIGLSGDLNAVADTDERSLKLSRNNGDTVLRYAGLTARDANGRELNASLGIERKELCLEIDDKDAHYPITIDPVIRSFTLTASDGVNDDEFGYSVAIDGNTVVVGAIDHNVLSGAAYVFVKPAMGWVNMTQTAELTASDGQTGDAFGESVSVSGNTVVVGAPGATVNSNRAQGATYVFVKPVSGWANMTETAKLTASDGGLDSNFGIAAAITGNTVVVGADRPGIDNPGPGAAYVFVEPNGGWSNMTQTAELTASDGTDYNDFGDSVSINGTTVVVGAIQGGGIQGPGAAYVFVEPPAGWNNMTETAKLTASDGVVGDSFGCSVSLGGNIAVIGAYVKSNEQGAVYVFAEPTGGWVNMTETAELTIATGKRELFGYSVSVAGKAIVAGAPGLTGSKGIAYVFLEPAGGWKTTSKYNFVLSETFKNGSDYLGNSVAVSGTTAVVGAWGAPAQCIGLKCASGPGEAFVFTAK